MFKLPADTQELAWAAGFFDGEGTVYARINDTKRPYGRQFWVKVGQGDPRPLVRFQRAVAGLGSIGRPYRTGSGALFWEYSAGRFEHAQMVLILLWPYLSAPKKEQAKQTLKALRKSWRRRSPHRPKGYRREFYARKK